MRSVTYTDARARFAELEAGSVVERGMADLVSDIIRSGGDDGFGQPERLRGDLAGWSSRRIDAEHRIVCRVTGDTVEIIACRGHDESPGSSGRPAPCRTVFDNYDSL